MTLLPFYPKSLENYSLKEEGLELNHKTKSWIKSKLESLSNRVPSRSKIFLRYQWANQDEQIFNATLEVSGPGHSFQALARGTSPKLVYQLLEKDLDEQIEDWKQYRFVTANSMPALS